MSLAELFKRAKTKGYSITIDNDINLDIVIIRVKKGIVSYNALVYTDRLKDAEYIRDLVAMCEKRIGVEDDPKADFGDNPYQE